MIQNLLKASVGYPVRSSRRRYGQISATSRATLEQRGALGRECGSWTSRAGAEAGPRAAILSHLGLGQRASRRSSNPEILYSGAADGGLETH